MKAMAIAPILLLSVTLFSLADDMETKVVGPGIKLVRIPGGTFQMGSNEGDLDELPVHLVTVKSFYIGETEVTNQQYCTFLNSKKPARGETFLFGETLTDWISIRSPGWNQLLSEGGYNQFGGYLYPTEIWYENGTYHPTIGYENNPVILVSWYGAQAFCKYYKLRLPKEEEWEYAAGGPNHYKFPWGNEWAEGMCCYNRIWSNPLDPCPTMAVKSYQANGYGLYDMSGNVFEWCRDWYDVYPGGISIEPLSVSWGNAYKVLRGGSWLSVKPGWLRCATRAHGAQYNPYNKDGFRVAGD